MAAETIAWFILGGERDDLKSHFITTRLQWHWLRAIVCQSYRSKRGG